MSVFHRLEAPTSAPCCPPTVEADPAQSGPRLARMALVGNPNVGKSTLFNALTGARQHVGNWPGKTVHVATGSFAAPGGRVELIDLPGTYSLVPRSPDEALVREVLVDRAADGRPDGVVVVLDAANLGRNLYLLAQVLETGLPVIVALTMLDVAAKRGVVIDPTELARRIGAPVVRVRPRARGGLAELTALLDGGLPAGAPPVPALDESLDEVLDDLAGRIAAVPALAARVSPRWLAAGLLTGDDAAVALAAESRSDLDEAVDAARARAEFALLGDEADADLALAGDLDLALAERRYAWVHETMTAAVVHPTAARATWSDRVDRVLTSRWFGLPIFLTVMYGVFEATTRLAAPLQDLLAKPIDGPLTDGARHALSAVGLADTWVSGLVTDGLIAGVGMLLSFVPLMLIMFVLLAVLEDSGYMARAAFVADRFLRMLGLPGRAFLPLIVGFGCNVPAVAGTRILSNARHRLMTTLLVPFVSCSARLPVYVLLGTVFFGSQAGTVVFAMYVLSILFIVGFGLVLRHTVFRSSAREALVLELPPYRTPTAKVVANQSTQRLLGFLRTAGGIIVATVTAVWLAMSIPVGAGATGGFGHVGVADSAYGAASRAIAPAFSPAGFGDWHVAGTLATGFVAKEAVITTFAQTYSATEPDNLRRPGDLGNELRGTFAHTSRGHAKVAVVAFLVFVLAYTPCMATVAAQRAEIGWRWTLTGMAGQLAVAWLVAVLVFQVGRLIW